MTREKFAKKMQHENEVKRNYYALLIAIVTRNTVAQSLSMMGICATESEV